MPEEREHARSVLEHACTDVLEQVRDVDETRARLLDAAYDLFCLLGLQRTSMEEAARAAKLSRVTVYRKFSTKDTLVEQLTLRLLRRYFARLLHDVAGAETAADRVVAGMLAMVREFVAGQLCREQHAGTVESDPDTDLVAELMVRISASFLTVPSRIVDISDDDQLITVARQFLVPMLEPRR